MSRPSAPRSRRVASGALSIGALSRATGVPVQTLRTWETRYGEPVATRKPSGHRVYDAQAVELVRRVARLLALGHRPADLFGKTLGELDGMLEVAGARLDPLPVAAKRAPAATRRSAGFDRDATLDRLELAAREMDRAAIARELREAWARCEVTEFLGGVVGAFLARLGERWEAGTFGVAHEHFASAAVFDTLRELRAPLEASARGPRAALAALPGELHEGGLHLAATLLAVRGWRVTWLGANTPVDAIAAAARVRGTSAVLVSTSAAADPARVKRTLGKLRESLPRRMPLWLGGGGAPAPPEGIERFTSLTELDARLAELG
ncbi:MAG: MerR family transcriptional regulator [Candidatus Eisenbacteria bacterium]